MSRIAYQIFVMVVIGCLLGTTAFGIDRLHLKTGAVLTGKIRGIESGEVRIEVIVEGHQGRGTAMHRFRMPQVELIDFGDDQELDDLFAQTVGLPGRRERIAQRVESLWDLLPVPNSLTGSLVLALVEELLAAEKTDVPRALGLCEAVKTRDWDTTRQGEAVAWRLRALLIGGQADRAAAEAQPLIDSEETSMESRLEARLILADATFGKLRRFVEEHPRWELDREVRGIYDELFETMLEHYLYPALFHGSESAFAARGLWGAHSAQLWRQDLNEATAHAEAVSSLYPETTEGSKARAWLDEQEADRSSN